MLRWVWGMSRLCISQDDRTPEPVPIVPEIELGLSNQGESLYPQTPELVKNMEALVWPANHGGENLELGDLLVTIIFF